MRWRPLPRAGCAEASGFGRRRVRIRWAFAGSLLVHGTLAVVLLSKEASTPTPLPEPAEIAFELIQEPVPATPLPAPPAPAPTPAALGGSSPSRPTRAKVAIIRGDAVKAGPEAADDPMATPDGSLPVQAASSRNPLATFQPAHPNLTGPMRFPVPDEKTRDLLTLPGKPHASGVRDLPKDSKRGTRVTAQVAEDGSVRFQNPRDISDVRMHGLGIAGRLDLTDQIMKRLGQDPYVAIKRDMLEKTREERHCMAKRYRSDLQKQELIALSTKVRHIAARTDLPAAERRGLVFDLWDECAEESETTTVYGDMARATILAIAREAFPAGTDLAYSPAELLALNERRSSRQPFAPYDLRATKRSHHPDAVAPTECP